MLDLMVHETWLVPLPVYLQSILKEKRIPVIPHGTSKHTFACVVSLWKQVAHIYLLPQSKVTSADALLNATVYVFYPSISVHLIIIIISNGFKWHELIQQTRAITKNGPICTCRVTFIQMKWKD